MAKRTQKRRKRPKRKLTGQSSHASLAALAPLIETKQILDPIHQQVKIDQKTVDYRPTHKLVFVTLGLLAGCEYVCDINHRPRPDKTLLHAFGYSACADQSVIQDTLDAPTAENVVQLEGGLQLGRDSIDDAERSTAGNQAIRPADLYHQWRGAHQTGSRHPSDAQPSLSAEKSLSFGIRGVAQALWRQGLRG